MKTFHPLDESCISHFSKSFSHQLSVSFSPPSCMSFANMMSMFSTIQVTNKNMEWESMGGYGPKSYPQRHLQQIRPVLAF